MIILHDCEFFNDRNVSLIIILLLRKFKVIHISFNKLLLDKHNGS